MYSFTTQLTRLVTWYFMIYIQGFKALQKNELKNGKERKNLQL